MALWVFSLLFYFFICVCFLCCCFFCVIFVCVCVCTFFGWMGRVFFFKGRKAFGSLQLYQRQEFNKHVVLFAIRVQNTGHIFLLLVCIVALGQNKRDMFLVPARAQKPHRTCFSFYILFSDFPPENGAKTFSSTHSDIRYRLIRENVAHSCTGNVMSNY